MQIDTFGEPWTSMRAPVTLRRAIECMRVDSAQWQAVQKAAG